MPEEFGGVRTVLDVAGQIEKQRQAREQQEMLGVMNMFKIDPKGGEGAWNRGYLGMKYGRITYDPGRSKGSRMFVHGRDGAGKPWAVWANRDTMEVTPAEIPGEARPGGVFDIPAGTEVELTKRRLPRTEAGVVKLGEIEAEEERQAEIAKAPAAANKELKELMALNEKDYDSFIARLQADPDLKGVVRTEREAGQRGYERLVGPNLVVSKRDLMHALRGKHAKLAGKRKVTTPTRKPTPAPAPAARAAAVPGVEAQPELVPDYTKLWE